jgi:hypothetical protein
MGIPRPASRILAGNAQTEPLCPALQMDDARTGPGASGGQGRDRTVDLPLFRRTLVPTELPGPCGC